jgi:hypothetical protein
VDVGAQPDIVGEVPAVVVGIVVDDDVVAIPEPVIAVSQVEIANAEIEASKPKAVGASSAEAPYVTAADAAGEVAVFPGMIEVEAHFVVAIVVSDPLAVVVDVGGFGMTLMVSIRRGRRRPVRRGVRRRGTIVGNVTAAYGALMVIVLRQNRE